MKRMLILTVTLWLGVSATAHAQVNSPTNAASTVTGAIVPTDTIVPTSAIVPSGQGLTFETGGGLSPFVPAPLLCPFGPVGVSLSAMLTPFLGCASDPLSATYQISAGPGVVITGPVGTPNATSGAGGVGGGVSSSAGCLGEIPSTAGSVGAGDLFGGIGGCTATPNATSGAGGAVGGVSSSAGCLGEIPSMAGSVGAGDLFGGIGEC